MRFATFSDHRMPITLIIKSTAYAIIGGGGRASARITLARVVAGALAKLVLRKYNISIQAYTSQIGNIALERDYRRYDLSLTEKNAVRCPDEAKAKEMESLIAKVKSEGDTIGGVITCVVKGCPVGLGEPEFGKLHAQLGAAMLSINAAKGFEYGEGFDGSTWRGSQQNRWFCNNKRKRKRRYCNTNKPQWRYTRRNK